MRPLLLLAAVLLPAACATTAPAPAARDRYAPDQMRNGPSLTETGRFGVTPVSRGGVHIEDARADGTPVPVAAPPARRHKRVHGTRTSERKPAVPR